MIHVEVGFGLFSIDGHFKVATLLIRLFINKQKNIIEYDVPQKTCSNISRGMFLLKQFLETTKML